MYILDIVLKQSTKKEKEVRNKRHTNENGEEKLFLSANGIILYTQKPNISTRKPVKLINSSFTRYINIKNSTLFIQ